MTTISTIENDPARGQPVLAGATLLRTEPAATQATDSRGLDAAERISGRLYLYGTDRL